MLADRLHLLYSTFTNTNTNTKTLIELQGFPFLSIKPVQSFTQSNPVQSGDVVKGNSPFWFNAWWNSTVTRYFYIDNLDSPSRSVFIGFKSSATGGYSYGSNYSLDADSEYICAIRLLNTYPNGVGFWKVQ